MVGITVLWPPLGQRTQNCNHSTLLHTGIQSKHLSFPTVLLLKQMSSPTPTTAFFSISVVFLESVPAGLHPQPTYHLPGYSACLDFNRRLGCLRRKGGPTCFATSQYS